MKRPLLFRWLPLSLLTLSLARVQGLEVTEQPPRSITNQFYGPHPRNTLDFWQAKAAGPRPLLVYIHGGGWITGSKEQKMPNFRPFLDLGISCAAINYRLAPTHPLPAPVHDAARAVQYLRSRAVEWNLDTRHIALTGPSAGGCTAIWILLHDDLAHPGSNDPVLRQSSRVCAAAVTVAQTSIDPEVLEAWLGPRVLEHPMISRSVGETNLAVVRQNEERYRPLFREFSPIQHLDAQDPPLFLTCNAEIDLPARDAGHGIHHPVFGLKLKEASDRVGHECHLLIPGTAHSESYPDAEAFLKAKLLGNP